MDCANLLINIDILKVVEMSLALPLQMSIEALDGRLLSPGLFILREGISCRRVEDIAPLTSKSLQVVGHINMGNIGCSVT